VMTPGPVRRYLLLKRSPGLRTSFLRLAEHPTDDAIRTFADLWGALGKEELLVPIPSPSEERTPERGESAATWRDALAEFRMLWRVWQDVSLLTADASGPVHLKEARGHIRVRRLPDRVLIDLDPRHHGLSGARFIAWPGPQDEEVRERLAVAPYEGRGPEAEEDRIRRARLADVEAARYFVHKEINKHLVDVHPAVLPFADGRMRLIPSTLLSALYLRFGQALGPTGSSGLPERTCDHCGEVFLPGRTDKRYCSDRCSERARYRVKVLKRQMEG
jgi:hypothetical protein